MSKDPVDKTIEAVEKEKRPFELIVGDETGEILNGDIPVRWCVTPELVSELEEHEVVDAHVLLVTATEKGTEMDRKLVPITELMTYVRFTRAGTMKIYGFIMSGKVGRKKLYQTYRQKNGGEYSTGVICDYTENPYDDIKYEYTRTQVDVVIPAGVFGKEPGPWMKWFVNMWHTYSGRVVDECHYRRRLILAFTLKWIPVLIWTVGMVLVRLGLTTALAVSGYYKNIRWGRIFRPYEYNNIKYHIIDDLPDENSFIVSRTHKNRWNGEELEKDMFFTIPFFPSLLAAEWLSLSFIFMLKQPEDITVLSAMGTVTGVLFIIAAAADAMLFSLDVISNTQIFDKLVVSLGKKLTFVGNLIDNLFEMKVFIWLMYGALAIIAVLAAITWVYFAIYGLPVVILMFAIFFFGDKIFERFENILTVSPKNNDYTEIRELLCPKDELNLVADIDFIPPKQRTVRLWYLEMKHKICKPMQQ